VHNQAFYLYLDIISSIFSKEDLVLLLVLYIFELSTFFTNSCNLLFFHQKT